MIAVDTNILVHAHRRDASLHEPARNLVRTLASQGASWAIPWPCIHEFYGVVTHPRAFTPPSSQDEAWTQIHAWVDSGNLMLLSESRSHLDHLEALTSAARTAGAQVHAARIAAICLSHGISELITLDRDFSRFPQLRTRCILI